MGKKDEAAHAHAAHHGDAMFEMGLENINRAAGFVIIFASLVAALNVVLLLVSHVTGSPAKMWLAVTQKGQTVTLDRIQLEFGRLIAFSLLLLVGADVIETLIHPLHDVAVEDLNKMGIMGVLRTGLAYFLAKEVEHLAHSTHEGGEHDGAHGEAHGETKKTK